MAQKLWEKSVQVNKDIERFTVGRDREMDLYLAKHDVLGSMAHITMLESIGLLTKEELRQLLAELKEIYAMAERGEFVIEEGVEDVHSQVELMLTRNLGDIGKKIHSGRSRNDQVATDTRLGVKALAKELMEANLSFRHVLVDAAKKYDKVILPGYTHMQHAQPVLLSHHLLAYSWMFARDFTRLKAAFDAADNCPLGAAALAGTSYPLDRQMTAAELGFAGVIPNSLDAVSDRDFLLDLHYAGSVMAMHLSRLSEEIVLWSSSEFGFITLSDSYSTGSSIMPQKKNPDFAELIRGKSGRVYGNLVQLLVTMKGLPLAYNKDLQEDKEGALDTAHTLMQCLSVMAGMISTWTVNEDAMARECGVGHLAATDVADYLAKRGLPFREAHAVVGHLVLMCEKRGCNLEDLPFEVFQEASPLFERDITEALDIPSIVAARTTEGGTAPAAVAVQLERAEVQLVADEGVFGSLTKVVEMGHGAK